MKCVIVVCFFALAAVALARPNDDKYTDRWDSVNYKEILENSTLLKAYASCILGKGKCTPEGKELKSNMQEAIETDCAKCTEAQRKGTDQVITHLVKHEPELWNELKTKFDPSGKHSARFEKQ